MNVSLTKMSGSVATAASMTAGGTGGADFAEALGSAIGEVESSQQNAKSAAIGLLTGGKGDIHNVALASQRAELSLELFQQVRNKFVTAYQEIMKTPM